MVDLVEDLALAGDGAARQAAGHDLGQDAEVGRDAQRLLRAARRPAEAGDDLVHQHHHAALGGHVADRLHEARRQRHLAPRRARRLEHHDGDVVAAFDQLHDRADIVGRHQDREIGDALRDARHRGAVIVRGGAGRDVVVPAMEVADEAHDLVLAGMGARQADRHVRGLGARRGEAHLLGRRDQLAHQLGPAHFQLVARAVMRAEIHLALHRLDHGGMGMAQQHGAVAAEIVDIFVAVDVPLARALGAGDVDGIGVEIARIVRNAAGQHLAGALEQRARAGGAGAVVGQQWRNSWPNWSSERSSKPSPN